MLIHPLAERLRLAAMADTFLQMQLDPAAAELSREDWLGLLLEREVTARDNKRYRILFSDNITDRMLGNRGLFEHMLNGKSRPRRRDRTAPARAKSPG